MVSIALVNGNGAMHSNDVATVPGGARSRRNRLGKKEKQKLRSDMVVEAEDQADGAYNEEMITDTVDAAPSSWSWIPLVDSEATTCPVLFSSDSKYSLVAVGASVKIYSVATAQLLSTLSIPTSNAGLARDRSLRRTKVTCLLLNPANSLQLIVGSMDGMLRLWDYQEGKLIRTLDLGSPVQHACGHPIIPDQIFVALVSNSTSDAEKLSLEGEAATKNPSTSTDNDAVGELAGIYAISLKPKGLAANSAASPSTPRSPARRMRLAKARVVTSLGISSSGAFLVSINPRQINICNTRELQRGFASRIESAETLTCLAFHPTENYFATGDQRGQIRLWYGILEEGEVWEAAIKAGRGKAKAVAGSTAVFHWHSQAVSSITFTPNGAYLLSGGEEAVLVLWQLHTGHREFVPRLGSPILTLSISNSVEQEQQVAARLRDGTIVFVGSQKLKISKSISGIKADPVRLSDSSNGQSARIPLGVQPTTKHLVLPSGHPSSLQFYSIAEDTQTMEVEVSPSNRISAVDSTVIEPTRIELVAFSTPSTSQGIDAGSYWMATLDTWSKGSFADERHIKFWRHASNEDGFQLTTRIDSPHDDVITSMSFSPSSSFPLLLTTSLDGSIKVWAYGGDSWRCRSSSTYRSFQPLSGAWSHDGSMYAIAHPTSVTLWSLASNSLIHAFLCPSIAPARTVEFVGEEGTLLLAGGKRGAIVWDLLTFEETLSMGLMLNELTAKPKSSVFVATELSSSYASTSSQLHTSATSSSSGAFILDAAAHSCQSRPLPFPVRQSVWLDSRRSLDEREHISLVVVNSIGEVLLVGEKEARGDVDVGDGAESIDSPVRGRAMGASRLVAAGAGQSRLFDDIFGVAAGGKRAVQDYAQLAISKATVRSSMKSTNNALDVLDTPSHMLPPARLLWRTMLGSFAQATNVLPTPLPVVDSLRDGDADVAMIDIGSSTDVNGGTTTVKYAAIHEEELVQLFRQHL